MTKTFILVLTMIQGDPETGPLTSVVLSTGLSEADCVELLHITEPVWLGNNNVGMSCEVDMAVGFN